MCFVYQFKFKGKLNSCPLVQRSKQKAYTKKRKKKCKEPQNDQIRTQNLCSLKNTQKFSEIDLICEIRGFIYKLKQYIHQYLLNSISGIPKFGWQCSECLDFTPFQVNIPPLCSLVFCISVPLIAHIMSKIIFMKYLSPIRPKLVSKLKVLRTY